MKSQALLLPPSFIRFTKIGAVALLFLLVAMDRSWLRERGLTAYITFWITNACMLAFMLATSYDFLTRATPSIRAFRWIRAEQPQLLLRIPITHYSVLLRIMSRDLLYLLFAANLIYLSFRIPMVRWMGLALGSLLILLHLYSLLLILRHRHLIGIFVSPSALLYYEDQFERIQWSQVQHIEIEEAVVWLFLDNGDRHELDFEDEETHYELFEPVLLQQAEAHGIRVDQRSSSGEGG